MKAIKLLLYILVMGIVVGAFAGYVICPTLAIFSLFKLINWKLTIICVLIHCLCQGIAGVLIVIGGSKDD